MPIKVGIAPGELIDKLTILEIKLERMNDADKLRNVRREYDELMGVYRAEVKASPELGELTARLKEINGRLWTIEDDIRDLERAKEFGPRFVALARSVYRTNDERAAVKRQINVLLASDIIEEKSYAGY
jgi:Family of unknown function (DUF6165)